MACPRCGLKTPSDAAFCPGCGAKLVTACPQCGTANRPDDKFCKQCGGPLVTLAGAPAVARFGSPGAYTPRHLAEKILTSKSALEGERKQVTVLFADLKGSMELLAARDSEEARALLDAVLQRMMDAVHHYEGTVNQVMGDGIMALFGAPLAHEDHAVRACYAALRMQDTIRRYGEEVRPTHGVTLHIRVGLNSGDLVVRSIADDLRMDYTAVGQTIQLAALVGEAGLGKSRLFWEFAHSHRTQGWVMLESGSVSYGKATSYLPVIGLLKAYFRVGDRDSHREVREKVTGKLLTLDRALE